MGEYGEFRQIQPSRPASVRELFSHRQASGCRRVPPGSARGHEGRTVRSVLTRSLPRCGKVSGIAHRVRIHVLGADLIRRVARRLRDCCRDRQGAHVGPVRRQQRRRVGLLRTRRSCAQPSGEQRRGHALSRRPADHCARHGQPGSNELGGDVADIVRLGDLGKLGSALWRCRTASTPSCSRLRRRLLEPMRPDFPQARISTGKVTWKTLACGRPA
jgi:hypothetical protein